MILQISKQSGLVIFASSILALSVISCGVGKKNDTNEVSVPVVLQADVTVDVPKTMLYLNKEIRNKFSEVPFINETNPSAVSLGGGMFSAVGDGGLGVSSLFDEENKLEKYEGIPVHITGSGSKGESPSVFVIGSGDLNCNKIFTYDSSTNKILIDNSSIKTLTTCSVKVQASLSLNGKVVSDEKEFEVVLNPTLATYSSYNDSTYQYLSKFSSLNDNISMIAKWLRDPMVHSKGLNLRYNTQMEKLGVNIYNANALTGAQSVTKLDLSGTDIRDLKALIYLNNLKELNLSGCKKLEAKDLAVLGQLKSLRSLNVSKLEIKDLKSITDNIKDLEELDISDNTQITDLEDIENLPHLRKLKASGIGLRSLEKFSGITQITELDISNNDFSNAKKQDVQTLVNLYNLESLNVSKSHFSNEFLDNYFGSVYLRNTLKTFIDANAFFIPYVQVSEEGLFARPGQPNQ